MNNYDKFTNKNFPKKALTLIELLVVIAIISILAGIAFPTISKFNEKSKNARCLNNLKQIGTALIQYYSENPEQTLQMDLGSNEIWPAALGRAGYLGGWNGQTLTKPFAKGVWACPCIKWSGKPSQSYGGYGVVEAKNLFDSSSSNGTIRMVNIQQPSKTWLVGDAATGPDTLNPWYAVWQNPNLWTGTDNRPAFGRHGKTDFVNTCMFDGHIEIISRQQLVDGQYTYPNK